MLTQSLATHHGWTTFKGALRGTRSVTDIIIYINIIIYIIILSIHRESLVRNHEPRANETGNENVKGGKQQKGTSQA